MSMTLRIGVVSMLILSVALIAIIFGLAIREVRIARAAVLSGELTSSVFDSAATSTIFTIMWQGTQPSGTTVKFHIASSNCLNGATNAPTCSTGNWSYLGPDGSVTTYYNPGAPNTQVKVRQTDHNKRYFRYKVFLTSDSDGISTPTITKIILSWSR